MDETEREAIRNETIATRDRRRPDMETVIRVMTDLLGDPDLGFELTHAGPDNWIWRDKDGPARGFEKYFVLSSGTVAGAEGYPTLVIRQSYSVILDIWVTLSGIVAGPGESEIKHTLALMVANHSGAFHGFRYAANSAVVAGGDVNAALGAARLISEAADVDPDTLERLASDLTPSVPDPRTVN